MHRPKNLDTASALALLQESELESSRNKSSVKWDTREFKHGGKTFSSSNKHKDHVSKDDVKKVDTSNTSDKWAAIRAYRKANGLSILVEKNGASSTSVPTRYLSV